MESKAKHKLNYSLFRDEISKQLYLLDRSCEYGDINEQWPWVDWNQQCPKRHREYSENQLRSTRTSLMKLTLNYRRWSVKGMLHVSCYYRGIQDPTLIGTSKPARSSRNTPDAWNLPGGRNERQKFNRQQTQITQKRSTLACDTYTALEKGGANSSLLLMEWPHCKTKKIYWMVLLTTSTNCSMCRGPLQLKQKKN